jgi:hypothetical protein
LPHRERRASFKKGEERPSFRGAGCLFTNGLTILSGYQKKKGKNIISGLGGSREENESYMDTAFRETIEELFHVNEVPSKLLDTLKRVLKPKSVIGKDVEGWGIYVTVIFTFEDLETLLKYAERVSLKTPIYDTFPNTLSDLLLERNPRQGSHVPEIEYLTIIPLDIKYADALVQPELIEDMKAIYKHTLR